MPTKGKAQTMPSVAPSMPSAARAGVAVSDGAAMAAAQNPFRPVMRISRRRCFYRGARGSTTAGTHADAATCPVPRSGRAGSGTPRFGPQDCRVPGRVDRLYKSRDSPYDAFRPGGAPIQPVRPFLPETSLVPSARLPCRTAVNAGPPASAHPLQSHARRVPREVGPPGRLSDGGAELCGLAVGARQKDGPRPAAPPRLSAPRPPEPSARGRAGGLGPDERIRLLKLST